MCCVLALAAAAGSSNARAAGPCAAAGLRGDFAGIPGTHAPAQVEYALTLTNASRSTCMLPARPALTLLGAGGKPLPTHATPAQARRSVMLQPLASATATTLLAVDVPGPGDTRTPGRPCQPTALDLAFAAGGSTLTIPLTPPTSVCREGAITYHPFVALEQQAIPAGLLALMHTIVRFPIYAYTLHMRVDPRDTSWVEWSFGPAGPEEQIQGGIAFAHRVGGRWRDASGPGSADVCAGVPPKVLYDLGMSGC